jgi:hypothetical protein
VLAICQKKGLQRRSGQDAFDCLQQFAMRVGVTKTDAVSGERERAAADGKMLRLEVDVDQSAVAIQCERGTNQAIGDRLDVGSRDRPQSQTNAQRAAQVWQPSTQTECFRHLNDPLVNLLWTLN